MPDPTLTELLDALDHAKTEAARWKTCAMVLADRVRELTRPREPDRALELLAGSCPIDPCERAIGGDFLPCSRERGHDGPCAHLAYRETRRG